MVIVKTYERKDEQVSGYWVCWQAVTHTNLTLNLTYNITYYFICGHGPLLQAFCYSPRSFSLSHSTLLSRTVNALKTMRLYSSWRIITLIIKTFRLTSATQYTVWFLSILPTL